MITLILIALGIIGFATVVVMVRLAMYILIIPFIIVFVGMCILNPWYALIVAILFVIAARLPKRRVIWIRTER